MSGSGERLREARLRRGLEVAEAADRLRIPAGDLRALEWGRLDLFADPGRAAAALQAYEHFLGLLPSEEREPVEARPGRWSSPLLFALAAALLVVGIASAFGVLPDGDEPTRATRRVAAAPAATHPPAAPVPAPAAEAQPPPPPAQTNAFVRASRGDSWVEVRVDSPDGEQLYAGVLARGRFLRIRAERVWLRLGAASNVDVRVNGKPVPRLSGTVEVLLTPRGAGPA